MSPARQAATLLVASGLRKTFPAGRASLLGRRQSAAPAVDGVDMTVEAGEVHGLVGESGCGKSTLARLLLGLIEADSGRVLFQGRDIAELVKADPASLRSGIQIVFQNPYSSLNPRLTISSTLREVLRVRSPGGDVAQRVAAALDEVSLPRDTLRRYPRELSGGQLQRVGIARALLVRPLLLVADEPLSSLDLSVQAQIINLLSDLRERRGLSMLLISHDLRVVEHVADRVSVMYLGRIVETGPSDRLFQSPCHPYTRALMAAAPDPRRALLTGRTAPVSRTRSLPAVEPGIAAPGPSDRPRGCRFAPRCPSRMTRCASEEPGLLDAEGGARSACWLVEDDALARAGRRD